MQFSPISPKFESKSMDKFVAKEPIFSFLKANRKLIHGEVLDVGCGNQPYRKWLLETQPKLTSYYGIDIKSTSYGQVTKPNIIWDGISLPFKNKVFDTVLLIEVLEHCPNPEIILNEIKKVLKKGGRLLLTVPFIWPFHDAPNDEWRPTIFALKRILAEIGFNPCDVQPMGGWDASLARVLALWACRRPMSYRKRKLVRCLLAPIIRFLFFNDKKGEVNIDSALVPAIAGIGIAN